MNLFNWLEKPFPRIQKTKSKLLLILAFAVFVFLFLAIFQPFGTSEIPTHKYLTIAGYGGTVFIGMLISYFVTPAIFSKAFNAEEWTIGKEIVFLTYCIIVISVFNYMYNTLHNCDVKGFVEFVWITFSVGIFPIIVMLLLIEKYLNQANTIKAYELKESLQQEIIPVEENESNIKIVPDTLKSEDLQINVDDFLYAKSDNYYITIYYLEGQEIKSQLMRLSLKKLEEQLNHYENIIRCHKSFVINKNHIHNIKGNARSAYLELYYAEEMIPISRNFSKESLLQPSY